MAKILMVEDDNSLREIYTMRLMAEGYTVIPAADGEEALAKAIREKPDLIVSDVMMPRMSGFEMLDLLRGNDSTKDIKVIMMTALSSDQQRERGENLGADRYLVKSQVGIEDVVATINEVLGSAGFENTTSVLPNQSPINPPEATSPNTVVNMPPAQLPSTPTSMPTITDPNVIDAAPENAIIEPTPPAESETETTPVSLPPVDIPDMSQNPTIPQPTQVEEATEEVVEEITGPTPPAPPTQQPNTSNPFAPSKPEPAPQSPEEPPQIQIQSQMQSQAQSSSDQNQSNQPQDSSTQNSTQTLSHSPLKQITPPPPTSQPISLVAAIADTIDDQPAPTTVVTANTPDPRINVDNLIAENPNVNPIFPNQEQ